MEKSGNVNHGVSLISQTYTERFYASMEISGSTSTINMCNQRTIKVCEAANLLGNYLLHDKKGFEVMNILMSAIHHGLQLC